jgi:N4-gp56 family major capsid protein
MEDTTMSGQVWVTNTVGGYMSAQNLSKELRNVVQPMVKFRQFADIKDAVGKNKGQIFTWDVFSDVATQGTTLVETNTMPETNFTITQGTMTIGEYGNSVPYTGVLDDLSELPVREIVNKALKNDAKKAFDLASAGQFNTAMLRVVPVAGTDTAAVALTTNGTATATNAVAFNKNHAKAIVDVMKERNIPPYLGDDYMAIAWPTTLRQLKNDLEGIHQYTQAGFQMILNGEIGRYENTRYIEQTNVPKGTNWGQNKSGWIYFFGEDAVSEGIAVPEEVRGKIPGDYGRSKGVAWYYLGGFAKNRLTVADERIVKWDSAA